MAFRLEFSIEAERDFGLIFDHLLRSYLGFGESLESALDHAGARVLGRSARPRSASSPLRIGAIAMTRAASSIARTPGART